ncbi:MAG: hypothetical protein ACE10A_07305 [Acidiferrobacterales bacterium]
MARTFYQWSMTPQNGIYILGVIYHKDLVLAQNRVLLEARARD